MSNSSLHMLLAAALILVLSACSTLQGRISNSTYVSRDGEFSVWVPPLLDVECRDGTVGTTKEYVDCTTGHGYWNTKEGGYSLEWYKVNQAFTSENDFYAKTERILAQLVRGVAGKQFSAMHSNRLTINGRAAYQIVMRGNKDGIQAFCVATSIDFGKQVAVAYLLVPEKDDKYDGPVDVTQASTWSYYPKFINSIEKLATEP